MPPRSPTHKQASAFSQSKLFNGLSTFSELESRIAMLKSEKERGDAFEVFVEAYLNNDESAQADEVWVVGKVPTEILAKLNLPASDYGYDGVFRTRLGELIPYQAKFRTGRTALPYRELSTFFGISEKAERRVVITNSVGISEVAKSRTNFNATRGTDFDRLDALQLSQIAKWIDGIKLERQTRLPRAHQLDALNDIAKEFADQDRATVVMACGSGKTLVALWAAERSESKRILVLVPSLNLLRQTLHEWAKWTNWGQRFRYLCVCSDQNVATSLDEIEIGPEDTDFPVRTDPSIVKKFLEAGVDNISVVFCTYQSAPVVGEALRNDKPFDFGIFDEAHKTTGLGGSRYTYALSDDNLPILKRLFLTATPRHYNIRKRDKDGEFLVVSMDDTTVYGRIAHRLTFGEAVKQEIIVPYKVVISIVDSDMIDNAVLDQSNVTIKNEPIRAKWVANQIALKHAVEQHDVKRIITFHSRIAAAVAFASDSAEGIGFYLPSFQKFHVSGEQPTAVRDEQMMRFSQGKRAIITNARCLNEGVDVPSVDMVAFMNPRRSRVDIVQAVGRAMRTSNDGKTCGYVLIPLFLELRQGESLLEALERSDFSEIAKVLNAMRDNDNNLNDLIEQLSIDKGRTGGFDESILNDKVEVLGFQIQLSELAASIRTRIVNELGSSWDERYGQLMAFQQAYGVCNIPQNWPENIGLAAWCSTQKIAKKNNSLSPERIAKLEQLGLQWTPEQSKWDEMFSTLTAYKQFHGDCNIDPQWQSNTELEVWCNNQKLAYTNKTLAQEKTDKLTQIGFVFPEDKISQNLAIFIEEIRERQGMFERGVVCAPFDLLCESVCASMASVLPLGTKIPQSALLNALKQAGWIDCGFLKSREYVSKKHIFAAPELFENLSKSDLRRAVEGDFFDYGLRMLPATSQKPNSLAEQIRQRLGEFSLGVVGAPFHLLCDRLALSNSSSTKMSQAFLLHAFKEAGWIDCGRIASSDYMTKKHIFCAPDMAVLKKSELRRMVEVVSPFSTPLVISPVSAIKKTPLIDEIIARKGIFSLGLIASPFGLVCEKLTHLTPFGAKMPQSALIYALKEAGWVDCGRLKAREFDNKKHIFCAPDMAVKSKSELRRMAEDFIL